MVRSNGSAILYNVSVPIQGPVYFTTSSGATIGGSMLISLQQIVGSFNTGSTDFIFRNNTSTTTTTTTTTYTFNPTITPYITSNSGQSFSAGFITALVQAINNYNANQMQANQIVLVYSNGQVVDTSSTAGTSFFGPIYFITYSGQGLSQAALVNLQQIMNSLTQQWSINYYNQQQTGTIVDTSDPNCARYQGNTNICAVCSTRYYMNPRTSRCTAVSNQCNTFDSTNGACLSCYQGYTLSNGECYILVSQDAFDPNCKVADPNGFCQQCYQGYFYAPTQSRCVLANPLCQGITPTGSCVACYPGYVLQNGNCLVQSSSAVGNCRNFSNSVCYECSSGYIFSNGKCFPVNPQCKTYSNQTGECLSCYAGYILSNGNCIIGAATSSSDPSCRAYDQFGNCRECSERFFRLNGRCTQVSDLCDSYDRNNGRCLTCYRGYTLRDGDCYKMLVVQQPPPTVVVQQQGTGGQQTSQTTTVARQQGNADLQFGVVTVPVDSGTITTNTIPSGVIAGGIGATTGMTGSTSGSTTTTITSTTTGTTVGGVQGSTGTFPGVPAGTPNSGSDLNVWQVSSSTQGVPRPTGSSFSSGSTVGTGATGADAVLVTRNTTTVTTVVNGSSLPSLAGVTGGASGTGASTINTGGSGATGSSSGTSGAQWSATQTTSTNSGLAGLSGLSGLAGLSGLTGLTGSTGSTPSLSTTSTQYTPTSTTTYYQTTTTSSQPSSTSVVSNPAGSASWQFNPLGQSSSLGGSSSSFQSSSSSSSSSSSGSSSGSSLSGSSTGSGSSTSATANCKTIDSNGICTECMDGYFLFANFCVQL